MSDDVLQTVFICGGEGRRLVRSQAALPKCMVPLAGEPALAHLVRRFVPTATRSNTPPTVFVVRADDQTVGRWAREHLPNHVLVAQQRPNGVASAISLAASQVAERAIVVLGDLFIGGRFEPWPSAGNSLAIWPAAEAHDVSMNFGVTVRDGCAVAVAEKPVEPAGLACGMGVYLFTRAVLDRLDDAPVHPRSGEREITAAIAAAIAAGERFGLTAFSGDYINLNTIADVERAGHKLRG